MTSFLDLPFEIRHMMYKLNFTSTVLDYKGHVNSRPRAKSWVPGDHNLSLLRTCRMVHAETRDMWMGLVLFDFLTGRQMLDALAPLSPLQRQQIRHVVVSPQGIRLLVSDGDYGIKDIMWLLAGLYPEGFTIDTIGRASKTVASDPSGKYYAGGLIAWTQLSHQTHLYARCSNVRLPMLDKVPERWPHDLTVSAQCFGLDISISFEIISDMDPSDAESVHRDEPAEGDTAVHVVAQYIAPSGDQMPSASDFWWLHKKCGSLLKKKFDESNALTWMKIKEAEEVHRNKVAAQKEKCQFMPTYFERRKSRNT